MKKVILIPDSFKGTMDSAAICEIMKRQIEIHYPDAETVSIPVADGGEGSVDAFLTAVGGVKKALTVTGPFFEPVDSFYGIINDSTAIIEMAACAGLPLAGDHLDPAAATTFGVGELILDAVKSGCTKIIIGLGGSCTNDAGAGMAAALGVKFYDEKDQEFIPTGGTLSKVKRINSESVSERISGIEFAAMCDIDNPLYGPTGAAYVFGPQKGADASMVAELDKGLQSIAQVIRNDLGKEVSNIPGSGAAGGLGAGVAAFLNAALQPGIDIVLDTVHFDDLLKEADLVFTGEGKMDTQSLRGKVVIGVARRAKTVGVPVIAVVGDIGDNIEKAYDMGVTSIFSINRVAVPFKEAKLRSRSDLALTVDDIIRLLKCTHF
ncbi:glycerate kinase family protein [Caproiciproducens faecalis]|uniref:Glycerate kinase n=1 Tax=Caproiciproducens faecalis TaxID=2820301 RepID=A0ABS7DMP2_9FIRM|nr:glycerate kinase [Caproiciproducens faecalis]MBW7572060.1 glycerate kinase [Caproiciproducens faecalis]